MLVFFSFLHEGNTADQKVSAGEICDASTTEQRKGVMASAASLSSIVFNQVPDKARYSISPKSVVSPDHAQWIKTPTVRGVCSIISSVTSHRDDEE